jgi:hypothetical protein
MSGRDQVFLRFMKAMVIILLLYGAGMTATMVFGGVSENVSRALITGFSTMFAGIIGLGTGYLLGNSNGASHGDHS